MKTIMIKLSDENYRMTAYFLRKLLGKGKRTKVDSLVEEVMWRAVAESAAKELEQNGYHVKGTANGETEEG